MSKSQVRFVEPKGFSIYLSPVGAPMAIRTESDEIVILMGFARRPRNDVVYLNFDVATGWDGAAMTCLNEHAPLDFSWYWRPAALTWLCHKS